MSPICALGKYHGLEPGVLVGAGETDKVVLFVSAKAPLLVQEKALRLGVLVSA